MTDRADRAIELAEKKAAKASGMSPEAASQLVDPALRKCAAIASEIVGRTIAPDMNEIMALGDAVVLEIQKRLQAQMKDAPQSQPKPAPVERVPPRNKFI